MKACSGNSKPIKNVNNLDYLFRKSSWCVKNNLVNRFKICMFIENIIRLSANSLSLEHLFYANDLIEYLSENFASEPNYVHYLKRMLVLCLMPPTVKNITQCSNNISTLTRFYDIMGKCIKLVRDHTELCMIAFSVVQSSVLRLQYVPENSVSLPCCYEALENSDLLVTLMQCIGHHDRNSQTFLDDLLRLSYNIAVVSDRSALRMMLSDGVRILVDVLDPNLLLASANSYERLTVSEFVIMLLDQMFSAWRERGTASEPPPRVTRKTLEILFDNIKMETKKHGKMRTDYCYALGEIVDNCSIDEHEFSDEIITDMVMLCVWPEIKLSSHWLHDVRFYFTNESFIMKKIMLETVNKVFVNMSSKSNFQHMNTLLIKNCMMLSNVEYTEKTYGENARVILNLLLSNLPYLLINSVDDSVKTNCCKQLTTWIKSAQTPCSQERFSDTMANVLICIGIVSNDSYDMLRKFRALKADVLISSVVSDTLKADDCAFRTVGLCGLYVLNIFYRENQHNSETHMSVFNTVMRTVALYFTDEMDGEKFDQSVLLDILHFIKNMIIRQREQVENFVVAGGVEKLLDLMTKVKYPVQLVILGMLVDLTGFDQSAKRRVEKWKSAETGDGYVELACDIWRSEKIRFEFSDDEYIFREQREQTTAKNLLADRSPAVEAMYLCAQPKIYAFLRSVGFSDDDGGADDRDVNENTVRACGLATNFWDKATVAHIYHYYSLKLGEVWNENDMVSREPDRVPMSAVESESVDIMTIRHAYLIALLKMIKNRVHNADLGAGRSEIELENKLYDEIRHYHSNMQTNLNK